MEGMYGMGTENVGELYRTWADCAKAFQRGNAFALVRQCAEILPKSGSGKVMWRTLQEAESKA
jgi:hypothetical protein